MNVQKSPFTLNHTRSATHHPRPKATCDRGSSAQPWRNKETITSTTSYDEFKNIPRIESQPIEEWTTYRVRALLMFVVVRFIDKEDDEDEEWSSSRFVIVILELMITVSSLAFLVEICFGHGFIDMVFVG
ncbi:unnamed protein product [Lathyrus oleraceus]|uniref:uncharacterized protein LOC127128206 n=1 Tax=Pisum sativum TaxID=3888 RepID=UPI001FC477E8|nr:uncharacterized protein LOC127128206 [Pisum sativum]